MLGPNLSYSYMQICIDVGDSSDSIKRGVYYYLDSADCSTAANYLETGSIMKCVSELGYGERTYCSNEDVNSANAPWYVIKSIR